MDFKHVDTVRRSPQALWDLHFSTRGLDAQGRLSAQVLQDVRAQFAQFGMLHVRQTGLQNVQDLCLVLDALGFSRQECFRQGGRTSAAWQQKWVEVDRVRRLDYYPPELYLLPNTEVQYEHCGPQRVLFFCQKPAAQGGRSFVHSAAALEAGLRASGALGRGLVSDIEAHGLMIETGFLDRRHPLKAQNYFQSWQERFATEDPDLALSRAQAQRHAYDQCWWETASGEPPTLMTRILRSGFQLNPADQKRYLRFPRMAFDAPSAKNGFRRFPLGNGRELSEAEKTLLWEIYLSTCQGIPWEVGDILLFDNVRYGHSRESFVGDREVFVGMAGEVWENVESQPVSPPVLERYAQSSGPVYYHVPSTESWATRFSTRLFEVDRWSPEVLSSIRAQFERYGVLHLRFCAAPLELERCLENLGFGPNETFAWGGMHSGRTHRRVLSHILRATDDYPKDLWLLPHNEILYQRQVPARLLFFSEAATDTQKGGRTFVHSALEVEAWIRSCGAAGEALLADLKQHGLLIEMGFLDAGHPDKAQNYFRSWQDRFETKDRAVALARCLAATQQFDHAWWQAEVHIQGEVFYTLMTQFRVPAYYQNYLLFPRIALNAPALINGYRRYPKGNGEPFRAEEIDILLNAFMATREGIHYAAGDILLVDNIRYGHSREAFEGPRCLGVNMAGCVAIGADRAPD